MGLSLVLCSSILAANGNADQVCCVSDMPRAAVHASTTPAPVRLRFEELGDERLDRADRSGTALTLGYWFDEFVDLGVQATWFYAGGASDEINAVGQSAGVPVLARPFFNAATGVEDAQLVAYQL